MVSFSKLLVCTTDCRNHSPAPLLPPQGSPGRQWRMRQRIHPGLQSLTTDSKDAAKRRAERRGPCGAGSSLPAGAQSRPRLGCSADPAQAAAPPERDPAHGSGQRILSRALGARKIPKPSRVNFSSSQAPVHIGEHRQNLLRTARSRHRFNLQPQVRWICQKTTKGCDINTVYIVYSRGEN